MSYSDVQALATYWPEVAESVRVPHTEAEYQHLVRLLDDLIDVVGEDEAHPLASLMEVLGVLIEQYEDAHVPELKGENPSKHHPKKS